MQYVVPIFGLFILAAFVIMPVVRRLSRRKKAGRDLSESAAADSTFFEDRYGASTSSGYHSPGDSGSSEGDGSNS